MGLYMDVDFRRKKHNLFLVQAQEIFKEDYFHQLKIIK